MYSEVQILLGLTAAERWAAARQIGPRAVSHEWFVMLGVALLLVLLVLLVAISFRRHQQSQRHKAEAFDLAALQRGLTARERQIIEAIAARSGLGHTSDIFHKVDAFDRGAVQLLAECAQTRTPQETTELKAEIAATRQKLGIRPSPVGRGATLDRDHPSSRDIPVGKFLDLTGRREDQAVALHVEILRNDEIELAVALRTPLGSRPGDSWLARYSAGLFAWEFRTATIRCDERRLVLSHSDVIHFVNRRRFPRVPGRWAALIAPLPFVQSDLAAAEAAAQHAEILRSVAQYAPAFVEGTVTEFAGPGLRIEAPLQVQVEDRVLVVLRLGELGRDPQTGQRTVTGIGRVKRRRETGQGLALAVELTGLSDTEIDDLASLAHELSVRAPGPRGDRATGPQEAPAYVAPTT
jgi:hypothetical protein